MRILTLFLLFLLLSSSTPSEKTEWYSDFNDAQSVANENKKPILLFFSGSDWCKPCIRLRAEILEKEAFLNYARKNWILVNLDFPLKKKNQLPPDQKAHNEQIAEKYNSKGIFPLVLLLQASGEVIATAGYEQVSPEYYLKKLISSYH